MFFIFLQLNNGKPPSPQQLAEYVKSHKLEVKSDTINGYAQVYYVYDNVKVYVTSGSKNHYSPFHNGEYLTWVEPVNGSPQVVLYNLIHKTRLQLTFSGSNSNAKVDDGKVVWERTYDDDTAIYYFDKDVKRISEAYPSLYPVIKGDQVLYAQNLGDNKWRSMLYSTSSGQTTILARGDFNVARPYFEGDQIRVQPK